MTASDALGSPALRSARWLSGDDEVALENRAALRTLGIAVRPGSPIVGISNTVSDLNPCNSSMAGLIAAARQSVLDAGGTPVVFPTISLGEDLMKPTAMLYRNLLSIEIEEMVRAHPLDALILTGSCDKTIPGALMGAVSANVPTVMIIGGARDNGTFRGRQLAAGTDLWRASEEHRAGRMTDDEWGEFEACYSCSLGSCNVMGTALTMALVSEVLGFTVSGASTIPAADAAEGERAARRAGELAVARALDPVRPRELVTRASLANALTVVAGSGGSTNALVHLAAIAGRAGIRLDPADLRTAMAGVRPLVDVQPIGTGFARDLHRAGGAPVLFRALRDRLTLSTRNVEGSTLGDVVARAGEPGGAVRAAESAVSTADALTVLSGTLAPDGAVIKSAAAELLVHRGPAVVFADYDDLRRRIDDPALAVTRDSVLVLQNAGPIGGPGMPEWGMIPIPAKLAREGVTDLVRVSDARMSGTSFGTVVLHVAPESAVGGPLALVEDGDLISLDVPNGRLDLDVPESVLAARRAAWVPPRSRHVRGWLALYQSHVTQAPQGCDFDFMQAFAEGSEVFVEPTIGRS